MKSKLEDVVFGDDYEVAYASDCGEWDDVSAFLVALELFFVEVLGCVCDEQVH